MSAGFQRYIFIWKHAVRWCQDVHIYTINMDLYTWIRHSSEHVGLPFSSRCFKTNTNDQKPGLFPIPRSLPYLAMRHWITEIISIQLIIKSEHFPCKLLSRHTDWIQTKKKKKRAQTVVLWRRSHALLRNAMKRGEQTCYSCLFVQIKVGKGGKSTADSQLFGIGLWVETIISGIIIKSAAQTRRRLTPAINMHSLWLDYGRMTPDLIKSPIR